MRKTYLEDNSKKMKKWKSSRRKQIKWIKMSLKKHCSHISSILLTLRTYCYCNLGQYLVLVTDPKNEILAFG